MSFEDYGQYVGAETIERIRKKAEPLQGRDVVHISSTYYGGGVVSMLSPLTHKNTTGVGYIMRIFPWTWDYARFHCP